MKNKDIDDFNKKIYPPLGRCMYCGSSNELSNEHIIPYGLSGKTVLPKSACPSCATITGQFEQKVLRGPMRNVRILRKLRSRTKYKDAPKKYELKVGKGNKEKIVYLPINEYPILLFFPRYSIPAFFNPKEYKKGINMIGSDTISFGPRPEEVGKKLGVDRLIITHEYFPHAFARMIAKIAYSFAVAEKTIELIKGTSFPVEAILGKKDDIGKWVGTLTDPPREYKGLLHRISLNKDKERGILIGEVQLFSDSSAPSYGVILGKLK